jgi:hypothetical protein
MKNKMSSLENFALSRGEMKQTKGGIQECKNGTSCQLYQQDPNGSWYMTNGTCTMENVGGWSGSFYCYCNIGTGIKKLQSNGGKSRCWNI